MPSNWLNKVSYVAPGEPVQADVVNRADRTLADRTDHLKDRLDAAVVGRAIVDSNATIATNVMPGQPVYWNYTTQRYEQALASVANDTVTQLPTVQPSSDCVGLCLTKRTATLGDIVLQGIVDISNLDNAITGAVLPGRYYLSTSEPGKLTQQKPSVNVSVCHVQGPKDNCSDVPRVVVMPHLRDFIDEHTHYRFALYAKPAGTHTQPEDTDAHVITDADANLQGWLPAAHGSFNGKAPAGAKFGYNLSQHTTLANVWPPVPIQSVAVLWDKGHDETAGSPTAPKQRGASEVAQGAAGFVICDRNGIWWMKDCFGEVPWPADTDTTDADYAPESTACPVQEDMRVEVVFLRMLYGNDRTAVTKLESAPGSPILVESCDGTPSTTGTGDLMLDINLPILPAEAIGGQALKEAPGGNKLKAGWVTEGVFTTSNQLSLSSTRGTKRNLTTAELDEFGLSGNHVLHQGVVKLDYTDQLVEREISPQIIRLSDTVERLYMDIPYIGFPPGQASLLRVRLNVPDSNLGDNLQMKIRVQFFGRGGASQSLPALYMTYRRLPAPAAITGTPLEQNDTNLTFNSVVTLSSDIAIVKDSAPFSIAAGDTVLVTIGRTDADAYLGDVGVLRIAGIVYSAT